MKNNLIAVFTVFTIGLMAQGNSPFSINGPGDVFGTNFNNNLQIPVANKSRFVEEDR